MKVSPFSFSRKGDGDQPSPGRSRRANRVKSRFESRSAHSFEGGDDGDFLLNSRGAGSSPARDKAAFLVISL